MLQVSATIFKLSVVSLNSKFHLNPQLEKERNSFERLEDIYIHVFIGLLQFVHNLYLSQTCFPTIKPLVRTVYLETYYERPNSNRHFKYRNIKRVILHVQLSACYTECINMRTCNHVYDGYPTQSQHARARMS